MYIQTPGVVFITGIIITSVFLYIKYRQSWVIYIQLLTYRGYYFILNCYHSVSETDLHISTADGFLCLESPLLLEMRIKRLLKLGKVSEATQLAKFCSDHPDMSRKGHFKQLYLKCLCAASPNIKLIEEVCCVTFFFSFQQCTFDKIPAVFRQFSFMFLLGSAEHNYTDTPHFTSYSFTDRSDFWPPLWPVCCVVTYQ